jgi:hypothetical protein
MHLGGKRTEVDHDTFKLVADRDGVVRQPCFFCNAQVEFRPADKTGDVGIVMIEIVGIHEHIHGICHAECARRAKGAM